MPKLKQTKLLLITSIVAVAVLVVGGWSYYRYSQTHPATDAYRPKAPEGKATEPSEPSKSPTPTITPGSGAASSQSGTVTIASPAQGGTVTSGTKVSGTAKIASGKLYFRLKAGKSGQLASGVIAVPANPAAPAGYSFELQFTNQVFGGEDQGNLEVYTVDASGVENNVVSVLVNIKG
ncbi:MAG: hypothetical protein JWN01_87 [Patescibacteria group bacterium]|nr:hypothetical protein [Patescibacteria group bacterium]